MKLNLKRHATLSIFLTAAMLFALPVIAAAQAVKIAFVLTRASSDGGFNPYFG